MKNLKTLTLTLVFTVAATCATAQISRQYGPWLSRFWQAGNKATCKIGLA